MKDLQGRIDNICPDCEQEICICNQINIITPKEVVKAIEENDGKTLREYRKQVNNVFKNIRRKVR